jgi:hypothetical protein
MPGAMRIAILKIQKIEWNVQFINLKKIS